MAVKIKLKRQGKIRQPYYRIVVADSRTARDGRAIEEIGLYRPKEDPSFMQVDPERVAYWLSVGAQPTEAVTAILKVTGDWQKFKGEPAPEPMKVREPKSDKQALFEAAAKDTGGDAAGEAVTPKKKAAPKAEAKVDEPKADEAKSEEPAVEAAAEEPAAEAAPEAAEEPAADAPAEA